LGLLEYRNTPVDGLESPAQLLMSRQLRSVLPTTQKQLQPRVVNSQAVVARRRQCQTNQKRFYDRGSRPLPALQPGDEVFVQLTPGDRWRPARVTARCTSPRLYVRKTDDGSTYRRNRRFIRRQPRQTQVPPPWLVPDNPAPAPTPADPTPAAALADPYVTRCGRVTTRPKRLNYQPGFTQDA
jgi:hypothetical protein